MVTGNSAANYLFLSNFTDCAGLTNSPARPMTYLEILLQVVLIDQKEFIDVCRSTSHHRQDCNVRATTALQTAESRTPAEYPFAAPHGQTMRTFVRDLLSLRVLVFRRATLTLATVALYAASHLRRVNQRAIQMLCHH